MDNFQEKFKQYLNESKTYIDSWDQKEYTQEEVNNWIERYRKTKRMSVKDRNAFKDFFKRLGLRPRDYEKIKPKSILKLKRDGEYGYYAEGVIDGFQIRVEYHPSEEIRGQWCFGWYVNDKEMYSDCLGDFRQLVYDLDRQAKRYIEEYIEGYNG